MTLISNLPVQGFSGTNNNSIQVVLQLQQWFYSDWKAVHHMSTLCHTSCLSHHPKETLTYEPGTKLTANTEVTSKSKGWELKGLASAFFEISFQVSPIQNRFEENHFILKSWTWVCHIFQQSGEINWTGCKRSVTKLMSHWKTVVITSKVVNFIYYMSSYLFVILWYPEPLIFHLSLVNMDGILGCTNNERYYNYSQNTL